MANFKSLNLIRLFPILFLILTPTQQSLGETEKEMIRLPETEIHLKSYDTITNYVIIIEHPESLFTEGDTLLFKSVEPLLRITNVIFRSSEALEIKLRILPGIRKLGRRPFILQDSNGGKKAEGAFVLYYYRQRLVINSKHTSSEGQIHTDELLLARKGKVTEVDLIIRGENFFEGTYVEFDDPRIKALKDTINLFVRPHDRIVLKVRIPGDSISKKSKMLFTIKNEFTNSVSDWLVISPASADEGIKKDSSFVVISAIKSVSGEKPDDEFFSITMKMHSGNKKWNLQFMSLADLDIALSTRDTNTVGLSARGKSLTEAGFSANIGWTPPGVRTLFGGVIIKIFNGELFWGYGLGGIENIGSGFHTSSIKLFRLTRVLPELVDTTKNGSGASVGRKAKKNLYLEFMLHSEKHDFFKMLSVKGGILFPWRDKVGDYSADDIETRIIIAIPIGRVFNF